MAAMVLVVMIGIAAAAAARADVYWTNLGTGTIGRANLDGTSPNQSLITGAGGPGGIALGGGFIYWANTSTNSIGRANADGTGANATFVTGASSPAGVAVDGQYVYWANQGTNTIGRARLDGSSVPNQALVTGANNTYGVAVDSQHIYWTNANDNSIGRASLNGTSPVQNFITGASNPVGVAADAQHIYWSNYNSGFVGRANLDGSSPNQQFVSTQGSPFGLAVDSQGIYWDDRPGGRIGKATLNGAAVTPAFIAGASTPVGVAIGAGASSGVGFAVQEGQPFSGKVVDVRGCGLISATIDWGDGTATSTGTSDGATGIDGTHTYTRFRTADGTVTFTCRTSNPPDTRTASFQATVRDAPIHAVGRDVSAVAGQSFAAVTAHVTDDNPNGVATDLSAQVAWGDGTTSDAAVAPAAGGGFDVTGVHTYGAAGTYTASTSVISAGGASATATATSTVAAMPPAVPTDYTLPVVTGEARQGEPLTTTTGSWSQFPTGYQYQWLRCDHTGAACTVIPGATTATYVPVGANVGGTIRARTRAVNSAGTSLPADSVATGVVQPLVLRARFTYSPSRACVQRQVFFDASASKTPHPPITRYRFTTVLAAPDPNSPFTGPPSWGGIPELIADGPRSYTTHAFDFDRSVQIFPNKPALLIADPRDVTLTVTDAAGDSASYTQTVDFADPLSDFPQPQCRFQIVRHLVQLRLLHVQVGWDITKNIGRLSARLPCISAVDCPGSLTLTTTRRSFLAAGAARRTRAKALVLGRQRFYIVAHHTGTVAIKLTPVGRRLLGRRKRVRATLQLTTGITGDSVTHTVNVTLPARREG